MRFENRPCLWKRGETGFLLRVEDGGLTTPLLLLLLDLNMEKSQILSKMSERKRRREAPKKTSQNELTSSNLCMQYESHCRKKNGGQQLGIAIIMQSGEKWVLGPGWKIVLEYARLCWIVKDIHNDNKYCSSWLFPERFWRVKIKIFYWTGYIQVLAMAPSS